MEAGTNRHPRFSTDWGVRFLCESMQQSKGIRLHTGIAHEISRQGVYLLSDQQLNCQKRVAMQLMIPSMHVGAPQRIVKIIGQIVNTVVKEGKFLTEIEFMHFEEDGLKELEKNLRQRFGSRYLAPAEQIA